MFINNGKEARGVFPSTLPPPWIGKVELAAVQNCRNEQIPPVLTRWYIGRHWVLVEHLLSSRPVVDPTTAPIAYIVDSGWPNRVGYTIPGVLLTRWYQRDYGDHAIDLP